MVTVTSTGISNAFWDTSIFHQSLAVSPQVSKSPITPMPYLPIPTVVLSSSWCPQNLCWRKWINPCPPLNVFGVLASSSHIDTYLGGCRWDLISTSGSFLWKTGFLGARSRVGNFLVTESKAESECSMAVKKTSLSDIYVSKIYSKTENVIFCE